MTPRDATHLAVHLRWLQWAWKARRDMMASGDWSLARHWGAEWRHYAKTCLYCTPRSDMNPCNCPPKPYFSPGSLASGSATEERLLREWEAKHGGHPNAEAARLAGVTPAQEAK